VVEARRMQPEVDFSYSDPSEVLERVKKTHAYSSERKVDGDPMQNAYGALLIADQTSHSLKKLEIAIQSSKLSHSSLSESELK